MTTAEDPPRPPWICRDGVTAARWSRRRTLAATVSPAPLLLTPSSLLSSPPSSLRPEGGAAPEHAIGNRPSEAEAGFGATDRAVALLPSVPSVTMARSDASFAGGGALAALALASCAVSSSIQAGNVGTDKGATVEMRGRDGWGWWRRKRREQVEMRGRDGLLQRRLKIRYTEYISWSRRTRASPPPPSARSPSSRRCSTATSSGCRMWCTTRSAYTLSSSTSTLTSRSTWTPPLTSRTTT